MPSPDPPTMAWSLSAFTFPDRWWDAHLVRTPAGDVLPIRTRYPDGTLATGPVCCIDFDLPEDIEARKLAVRTIIVANLQPRTFLDPDHAPPPLEAPEVVIPETPTVEVETPTPTPVETPEVEVPEKKDVKDLLKALDESVENAKAVKGVKKP